MVNSDKKVCFTKEPTESDIGDFTRKIAETHSGIILACVVAADRYNHLEKEIIPKLKDGYYVFTDRYILSSFILQPMDGVNENFIYNINEDIILPDLQIAVRASDDIIEERLNKRATLTRFEKENTPKAELECMNAGIKMLDNLSVKTVVINNDDNLMGNVNIILETIFKLGEKT